MRTEALDESVVDWALRCLCRVFRVVEEVPSIFTGMAGVIIGILLLLPFALCLFTGVLYHLYIGAVYGP